MGNKTFKIIEPREPWIISKRLIRRLGLIPYSSQDYGNYGIVLLGEDGKQYEMEYILHKFLDCAEKLCLEK